ncbi:MAG: hypothetical protein M8364_06810 [Methylobacter sp.]|uniref:hypothetical protein n=1 Tax=Methylobacter sp. TaxID=2051955 RepID=UPI002585F72D|nr:hypothetical protein [Methylobacter sp.]MCL7420597.1 hypothetical protein [Methylobacter sp.]
MKNLPKFASGKNYSKFFIQQFLGNRMQTETYSYQGVIVRVSDDAGVAYIVSQALNRQYIFSYNRIKGYGGQSAKEIDLKPGRHVSFTVKNDVVQSVELL